MFNRNPDFGAERYAFVPSNVARVPVECIEDFQDEIC